MAMNIRERLPQQEAELDHRATEAKRSKARSRRAPADRTRPRPRAAVDAATDGEEFIDACAQNSVGSAEREGEAAASGAGPTRASQATSHV